MTLCLLRKTREDGGMVATSHQPEGITMQTDFPVHAGLKGERILFAFMQGL